MTPAERIEVSQPTSRQVRIRHGDADPADPSGRYEQDWVLTVDYPRAKPDDPGPIRKISLEMPGGITPTRAQRFGWSRWLRIAEGAMRSPQSLALYRPGLPEFLVERERQRSEQQTAEALAFIRERLATASRPGATGHPGEFYRAVADLYLHHSASGQRAPTLTIARQVEKPRNTVARWVSRARDLAYLPAARWGKAQ